MTSTVHELAIPPAAARDPDAVELIRVWVAEEGMHVSLNLDLFSGREEFSAEDAWGQLLGDITRHLANAMSLGSGERHDLLVDAIRKAYLSALDKPTGGAVGAFMSDDD